MVLVADECKVQRESGLTSIWYPRGKYPTVKQDSVREALSFYGALDLATGECTVLDTPWQNSKYTVRFLRKLEGGYKGKKVLLIWDGASHHRGEVKNYLARKDKDWKLELMYFPAYSPDLNPQEHVWKEARRHITHNSEDEFEEKTLKFYKFLVKTKFKSNFLEKYA